MLTKIARSTKTLNFNALRAFAAGNSNWGHIEMAPLDPIIGVNEAFKADKNPNKQLLGIGAYRTDEGKPYVLDCVTKAEERILANKMDHEYAGIDGIPSFMRRASALAFGEESDAWANKRIATCQSISGTGCLRVGMEFLRQWYPNKNAKVYVPDPSWPTHRGIAEKAGFQWVNYRYYDRKTRGFDCDGMLEDIDKADDESIVILHSCAHNPTGQDPTMAQWEKILEVVKRKNHLAAFDSAYQGFASGNLVTDSQSIRLFEKHTDRIVLFQSFAKNFGLYGERCGNLNVVCSSENEAKIVQSRLKAVARPMYSNPPIHGARIVDIVLGDKELEASWHADLIHMSDRMTSMRSGLVEKLKAHGSTCDWSHVTNQIGMFAYTGMSTDQVMDLRSNDGIYMTADGRISIAGLNTGNLDYVAKCFHRVTKANGIGA